MNRAERRRVASLLGIPPQRIVKLHPDGQVEICPDGLCAGGH